MYFRLSVGRPGESKHAGKTRVPLLMNTMRLQENGSVGRYYISFEVALSTLQCIRTIIQEVYLLWDACPQHHRWTRRRSCCSRLTGVQSAGCLKVIRGTEKGSEDIPRVEAFGSLHS